MNRVSTAKFAKIAKNCRIESREPSRLVCSLSDPSFAIFAPFALRTKRLPYRAQEICRQRLTAMTHCRLVTSKIFVTFVSFVVEIPFFCFVFT